MRKIQKQLNHEIRALWDLQEQSLLSARNPRHQILHTTLCGLRGKSQVQNPVLVSTTWLVVNSVKYNSSSRFYRTLDFLGIKQQFPNSTISRGLDIEYRKCVKQFKSPISRFWSPIDAGCCAPA